MKFSTTFHDDSVTLRQAKANRVRFGDYEEGLFDEQIHYDRAEVDTL